MKRIISQLIIHAYNKYLPRIFQSEDIKNAMYNMDVNSARYLDGFKDVFFKSIGI